MVNEIYITPDKVLMDIYKHIDLPIGTIIMNAGNDGNISFGDAFLLCNGTSRAVSLYPELSDVLNFKYGGSSGSGFFNLPNFLDRFPMGLLNVNGDQISNDPNKSPTTRQGGNAVIQSNQFTHGHASVSPTITGVNNISTRGNIDDEDPTSNTFVQQDNYPDANTIQNAGPHYPPYYTLNYFIYTGKGTIG